MPSSCNHTDSLVGLCILLLLMLSFRLLFVSHLCLVFICLPWKTHQYLSVWSAVAACNSVKLPLRLCWTGCSPLFVWDVFICLRWVSQRSRWYTSTLGRNLQWVRAQMLFTSLSASVNGLSREHWIKCWCLFPFFHPIPPSVTGIWKPVYSPAFPVSVAQSPVVMREVEVQGFCLKGNGLVTIADLSVVILISLNLVGLLACRERAVWVAVPKECFWMIKWQVNAGDEAAGALSWSQLNKWHLLPYSALWYTEANYGINMSCETLIWNSSVVNAFSLSCVSCLFYILVMLNIKHQRWHKASLLEILNKKTKSKYLLECFLLLI